MHSSLRTILTAAGALASTALIVIACGSNDDSTFGNPDGSADGSGADGSFDLDGQKPDTGDPFANDPPPPWCGPAGKPEPPKPGGTIECPDDKNKPGCGCLEAGKEAPCWTGLRANRNLGVCKDGVTKCVAVNENRKEWGECVGQVLPTPGVSKGAPACKCFSAGQWKIANLSPCFRTYYTVDANGVQTEVGTYAMSTVIDGSGENQLPVGQSDCPSNPGGPPPNVPGSIWSGSSLKVDCAGQFKLCLKVKAGNFDAPSPNDCTLVEVCTEDYYKEANVEQKWKDLPAWANKTPTEAACAAKWEKTDNTISPGYAEMIVKGKSERCDAIDDGNGGDFLFNRIKFCPTICRTTPDTAECKACQQAGQGGF